MLLYILLFILIICIITVNILSSREFARTGIISEKRENLFILGFGGVGAAVAELWNIYGKLGKITDYKITILEPTDLSNHPVFLELFAKGNPTVIQKMITPENITDLGNLKGFRNAIVLDCTVNVDALAIMKICNENNNLYINCSMENWDTENPLEIDTIPEELYERALFGRIKKAKSAFANKNGPTMLADQGMNPGIVSLFTMKAIKKMAEELSQDALVAIQSGNWSKAAELLKITKIHITERDTQTWDARNSSDLFSRELSREEERKHPVFENTWSAVGLLAEALDPIQIGKGKGIGKSDFLENIEHSDFNNIRIFYKHGIDIKTKAIAPDPFYHSSEQVLKNQFEKGSENQGKEYEGWVIPHGESGTLSFKLQSENYRPTVYFVYEPALNARIFLENLKLAPEKANIVKNLEYRVVPLPEIKSGADMVGAAIYSDYGVWWSGTILSELDVKKMGLTWSGPTTIQVAISILTALKWMIKNPKLGFITPEDVPLKVLEECEPFLGKIICEKLN